MKRVAIIGGGIAGLSAALCLEIWRRSGTELEYVLFESANRLGGIIRTERTQDGFVVEAGPDSFLTEKSWMAQISRDWLGLGGQLIASNDAGRHTYILLKRELLPLPEGLQFFVPTRLAPVLKSPLFSAVTKARILWERFQRPRQADADESVASLVSRHFGGAMVDRLVQPLLSGIYGGDADGLSAQHILPRLVTLERSFGSLIRGVRNSHSGKAAQGDVERKPLFTSFHNGMQQLVEAIAAQLPPANLRLGASVHQLSFRAAAGKWRVSTEHHGGEDFDGVVLAAPVRVAAVLLENTSAELAAELERVRSTSSIVLAFGYERAAIAGLPPGFGFLVPRREGKKIMACTFVHNKFSHRAPEGCGLLRAFLGGPESEAATHLSDAELLAVVRRELSEILKLRVEPLFARLFRWPHAMPQYEVGCAERMRRTQRLLEQLPGLALAGSAYRGIGVPDCMASGLSAAAVSAGVKAELSRGPFPLEATTQGVVSG